MPPLSAITGLPPWAVMWAVAAGVFALCKWLTWRHTPAPHAPAWRHVAYLALWPGLDARAFLDPRPLPLEARPTAGEWALAVAKMGFGAVLVWGVSPLVSPDYARAWVG